MPEINWVVIGPSHVELGPQVPAMVGNRSLTLLFSRDPLKVVHAPKIAGHKKAYEYLTQRKARSRNSLGTTKAKYSI